MLLDDIDLAIRTGQIGQLLGHTPAAFEQALRGTTGDKRLELRARQAELALLRVDISGAAKALNDWVAFDGSRVTLRQKNVEDLHFRDWEKPNFARGLLLSQLANLLYRTHSFDLGAASARKAAAHLERSPHAGDPRKFCLAACQNQIWWARLLWQLNEPAEARSRLRGVLDRLTNEARNVRGEELGGLDVVAALALSLEAALDWNLGNLDAARGRIYQALFLLRGFAKDPVRQAYALYTASRVELIYQSHEATWPLRLVDESIALFEGSQHPFEWRARVQRAQCLVRIGEPSSASDELDRVEKGITDLGSRLAPIEKQATTEELALVRIWIKENQALEYGRGHDAWQAVLTLAERLMTEAKPKGIHRKPRRLAVDGAVHYGLALVYSQSSPDARAKAVLEQAERDAVDGGHRKERIAALLALAECERELGNIEGALKHCDSARRLLLQSENDYLRQWLARVERGFSNRFTFVVNLDDKLKHTVAKVKEQFIHYALAVSKSDEHAAQLAGVNRSTVHRYKS